MLIVYSCDKQSKKDIETPTKISAMTYNIRLDIKSDGINQWDNRKEAILSIIRNYKPTIIGIQEALPQQVSYLQENLKQYGSIGEGRDGDVKGEACTIFYRSDQLQLLSKETFWLSETPKKPSIGWDAAYPRICTNGTFSQKNTHKKINIYNTHLDHIGETSKLNSIKLIIKHIQKSNKQEASILMGDFNSLPNSTVVNYTRQHLSDSNIKQDATSISSGTFNAFNIQETPKSRIDYIFSKNITLSSYKHLHTKTQEGNWPSDHIPIFVEMNFIN